jgi:hypothetical protein
MNHDELDERFFIKMDAGHFDYVSKKQNTISSSMCLYSVRKLQFE